MSDRRRRQKENRAARREAERKHESRRELFKRVGFAVAMGAGVVALFVLTSFLGGDSAALPGSYAGYRQQETACGAEQPPPEEIVQFEDYEPQPDITPESMVTATIETSCGPIVIELAPAMSPETVESFVFLARQDFYAGTVFHRILEGLVIEGGDPDAIGGAGGPGYRVPDEYPPADFEYEEGAVAMANSGRGTTGSQFFIVLSDDYGRVLAPQFNLLGRVVEGEETLERIANVPTANRRNARENSLPLETVYIESIDITVS